MGTTIEDQERLKELMKKALERQDKLEEKESLDSDAELFYNVYMESKCCDTEWVTLYGGIKTFHTIFP